MTGKAYVEQSQLGWNVLFRGFWTVSWREAHELVYDARNIREPTDTGEAWIGRVLRWFFELLTRRISRGRTENTIGHC